MGTLESHISQAVSFTVFVSHISATIFSFFTWVIASIIAGTSIWEVALTY
jgi:hypothetical protein